MTQTRLEAHRTSSGLWVSFRGDGAPSDPPEEPPTAGSSLGIGVTEARLTLWQERSVNGPYRTAGDAGTNTPGDWARIESNKNTFLSDPPTYWNPTYSNGSYWTGGDPEPNRDAGQRVLDAAFYALVKGDGTVADSVISWLNGQAEVPNADFRDTTKFRPTTSDAYFGPTTWVSFLTLAWDYCRIVAGGNQAERDNVLEWLVAGANWRGPSVFNQQGDVFWTDRYNLVPKDHVSSFNSSEKTHTQGHTTCTCHRSTNNRRLALILATGIGGMAANNQTMIDMATQYCKEYLALAFFPDIDYAEMHRSRTTTGAKEETGWGYTSASVGTVLAYADFLRVRGDTSLLDFTTRSGYHGSECSSGDPDKSMLNFARGFVRYGNGTFTRYGNQHTTGDADHLLNGYTPTDGSEWRGNREHAVAAVNEYYRDAELEAGYMRDTSEGFKDYWSNPSDGARDWRGCGYGLFPGVMFMYAQTEGVF